MFGHNDRLGLLPSTRRFSRYPAFGDVCAVFDNRRNVLRCYWTPNLSSLSLMAGIKEVLCQLSLFLDDLGFYAEAINDLRLQGLATLKVHCEHRTP
ncbi:hypothetical protein J6590_031106 [Homalodisca vitripennis]|nr:hypothetical protein J6590_031106 [Homalodisca vitripennis]